MTLLPQERARGEKRGGRKGEGERARFAIVHRKYSAAPSMSGSPHIMTMLIDAALRARRSFYTHTTHTRTLLTPFFCLSFSRKEKISVRHWPV